MIEIKVELDGGHVIFVISEDANIFEVGNIIRSALTTATYSDVTINEILVNLQ
jgi:hypothetical protein